MLHPSVLEPDPSMSMSNLHRLVLRESLIALSDGVYSVDSGKVYWISRSSRGSPRGTYIPIAFNEAKANASIEEPRKPLRLRCVLVFTGYFIQQLLPGDTVGQFCNNESLRLFYQPYAIRIVIYVE